MENVRRRPKLSNLISKDVAIKELRKYADIKCANGYIDTANGILSAASWIKNEVPTVDAEPIVYGKWIEVRNNGMCSICKAQYEGADYNYCPNCGAKMEVSK